MRIAYFTDSLPPVADGVTRTLCRLADTLERAAVDFRFFTAIRPESQFRWRERVHKVAAVPFPLYRSYRVGLPLGIEAELRRFAPDLIHVVSPTPLGLYGLERARRLGIPVVGSFHTDFCAYLRFYGLERWEPQAWRYLRWFYNRCGVTYAPSPSMAARLADNGIERVQLWERGIDMREFSPALRSESVRERAGAVDRPLLLFVGRLVREKNLEDLAAAVDLLRAQLGPRAFRVAIVGDGPMHDELRARLPDAHFAGYHHGVELAAWYASADAFVFPSTTETFGNVILEAFASGLPVVGADACGTRDLVTHGETGFLARPNAPDDLARHIGVLLLDPARRARMAVAAERAALRFHWPEVNARLLESYGRVTAAPARAA
jgi:glycosyltransferase involved in cell wall biosynthesis